MYAIIQPKVKVRQRGQSSVRQLMSGAEAAAQDETGFGDHVCLEIKAMGDHELFPTAGNQSHSGLIMNTDSGANGAGDGESKSDSTTDGPQYTPCERGAKRAPNFVRGLALHTGVKGGYGLGDEGHGSNGGNAQLVEIANQFRIPCSCMSHERRLAKLLKTSETIEPCLQTAASYPAHRAAIKDYCHTFCFAALSSPVSAVAAVSAANLVRCVMHLPCLHLSRQ